MATSGHRVVMIDNDGKEYEIALLTNSQLENEAKTGEPTAWSSTILEDIQNQLIPVTAPETGTTCMVPKAEETLHAVVNSSDKVITPDSDMKLEMVAGPSAATSSDDVDDKSVTFLWSHSAIATLVKIYKEHLNEFSKGMMKKKKMWARVAKVMESKGFDVTADMCDRKWRNLLVTYRMILRREKMNGSRKRRSWIYFNDVHEIMCCGPAPLLAGASLARKLVPKNVGARMCEAGAAGPSNSATHSPNSAPQWFLLFAEEEQKRHEQHLEMLRQIHRDVVDLHKEKNLLMRDLNRTLRDCFAMQ